MIPLADEEEVHPSHDAREQCDHCPHLSSEHVPAGLSGRVCVHESPGGGRCPCMCFKARRMMAGVASSFHVGAEAAIVHIGRLTAERDFLHEQVVNLAREQDALRAEVGIPASYWSEYFEAGLVRSREQVTTDHDRMWWDWLQQVKARGWKDSPSPTPTEPKEE